MPLVKLLEGTHVALSRFLSQPVISFLRRLDFGCGHVSVFGQARKNILSSTFVGYDYHESAGFKVRSNLFLGISLRIFGEVVVTLNADVMRLFARVVALPDPKDIGISRAASILS
jgi:hypothetical protein